MHKRQKAKKKQSTHTLTTNTFHEESESSILLHAIVWILLWQNVYVIFFKITYDLHMDIPVVYRRVATNLIFFPFPLTSSFHSLPFLPSSLPLPFFPLPFPSTLLPGGGGGCMGLWEEGIGNFIHPSKSISDIPQFLRSISLNKYLFCNITSSFCFC